LGEKAAPPPRKADDPEGPVQPLDLMDLGDIPASDDNHIEIEQALLSTKVQGVTVDVTQDGQRLRIEPTSKALPAPRSSVAP